MKINETRKEYRFDTIIKRFQSPLFLILIAMDILKKGTTKTNAAVQCNLGLKLFSVESGNSLCATITPYECIESCEWNSTCRLATHYLAFRGRRTYVAGMALSNSTFLLQCCASLSTITELNKKLEPSCAWNQELEMVEQGGSLRIDPPLAKNEYIRDMRIARKGNGKVRIGVEVCRFIRQWTSCDRKKMAPGEAHLYSLVLLRLSRTKQFLSRSPGFIHYTKMIGLNGGNAKSESLVLNGGRGVGSDGIIIGKNEWPNEGEQSKKDSKQANHTTLKLVNTLEREKVLRSDVIEGRKPTEIIWNKFIEANLQLKIIEAKNTTTRPATHLEKGKIKIRPYSASELLKTALHEHKNEHSTAVRKNFRRGSSIKVNIPPLKVNEVNSLRNISQNSQLKHRSSGKTLWNPAHGAFFGSKNNKLELNKDSKELIRKLEIPKKSLVKKHPESYWTFFTVKNIIEREKIEVEKQNRGQGIKQSKKTRQTPKKITGVVKVPRTNSTAKAPMKKELNIKKIEGRNSEPANTKRNDQNKVENESRFSEKSTNESLSENNDRFLKSGKINDQIFVENHGHFQIHSLQKAPNFNVLPIIQQFPESKKKHLNIEKLNKQTDKGEVSNPNSSLMLFGSKRNQIVPPFIGSSLSFLTEFVPENPTKHLPLVVISRKEQMKELLNCCQEKAQGCKSLCSRKSTMEEVKRTIMSGSCPPLSMTSIIQCFPRFYNIKPVKECCSKPVTKQKWNQNTIFGSLSVNRLPQQCLSFCTSDFKLSFSHLACIDHISTIVDCYRELIGK